MVTAVRTSRVVLANESVVALMTPAIDAPVSRSVAAARRKIAIVCAPSVPRKVRGDVVEPLPRQAAARLDPLGVPHDLRAAGPEPERAGGERERDAEEEADRAGLERPHGREHRAQDEDRAGRHQPDRHEVVDGADQDAQAVDGGVARLAAVPVEVDDEGEEDRGGDEAEPDDVEVALLERAAGPASTTAASGARGRPAASSWARAWAWGVGGRAACRAEPPSTPRRGPLPAQARLKVPALRALRA